MASLPLVTVVADSRSSFGKWTRSRGRNASSANILYRGINEGRQSARDVDTYLMGSGTQLPRTGGIVQRADYGVVGHPERMRQQAVAA